MTISELTNKAYISALSKGFWEDWAYINHLVIEDEQHTDTYIKGMANNAIATRLMLITSEVAEALEALRVNDTENFKEELADIILRVCDLAGGLNIDLEDEIEKKLENNENRDYKHGKEF